MQPWPFLTELTVAMLSAEDYIVCWDTPQQQLKRARLDQPDTASSGHWSSHKHGNTPSPEQVQPVASDICPDMVTGQGVGAMPSGVHPGGQHFHWMPVFCQMGSPGILKGLSPAALAHGFKACPACKCRQVARGGCSHTHPWVHSRTCLLLPSPLANHHWQLNKVLLQLLQLTPGSCQLMM